MTSATLPSRALDVLAAQHRRLREMIADCNRGADALDAGRIEPAQLLGAVAALRQMFDDHNELEEALLPSVMIDVDWLGAMRVSRMVEDHLEEHGALARELASSTSSELRSVLASLRAHLDSEERYFLSPKVLRDDLVR